LLKKINIYDIIEVWLRIKGCYPGNYCFVKNVPIFINKLNFNFTDEIFYINDNYVLYDVGKGIYNDEI